MDFADFEFESHRSNWLPLYCYRFQRMILSAFCLRLCGFRHTSITLKRWLSKFGTQILSPGNHCVRKGLCVQLFECSNHMQATARRQTVQRDDRVDQECPAPTLTNVCVNQRRCVQLPSPLESGV
jgi:hypothetical protein